MIPFASLACLLLLAPQASVTGLLAPSVPAWQPPVVPVVVERPFLAPAGPYSPGHRGVDLAAGPGQEVRAAGAGVVRLAGPVAGRPVVSIEHPQRILGLTGWRTTYDSVVPSVRVGERVRTGDIIGRLSPGSHTDGLHWGLRRDDRYADPLLLLRRPVVLKPLGH